MTNTFLVELTDGRQVFFSYGVPVAAFIPSDAVKLLTAAGIENAGYIKTATKHSVTTSKHVNNYARNAVVVNEDVFQAAIAPIVRGR